MLLGSSVWVLVAVHSEHSSLIFASSFSFRVDSAALWYGQRLCNRFRTFLLMDRSNDEQSGKSRERCQVLALSSCCRVRLVLLKLEYQREVLVFSYASELVLRFYFSVPLLILSNELHRLCTCECLSSRMCEQVLQRSRTRWYGWVYLHLPFFCLNLERWFRQQGLVATFWSLLSKLVLVTSDRWLVLANLVCILLIKQVLR